MKRDENSTNVPSRDRSVRTTFDQVAEIYDEVRPGYPDEVIEDVILISGIPRNGRILEIGCGTGQATVPFAQRGYSIHCLEMGKNMANIASENLRPYPDITIENIKFEDWPSQKKTYDMVLSATAFHWVPSEIGFPKAAECLKETGYLVLLSNMHPSPYTGFFERVHKVYQDIVPDWKDPREGLSTDEKIKLGKRNINGTGFYDKVLVKKYEWVKEFSSEGYIKLLNTFSNHRNLEKEKRNRLFNRIERLIDEEFHGKISRPYLTVLYAARKK